MRVALTADPEVPVPPKLYGGIERIVDLLASELVERGHEVAVFAHPDSRPAGSLIPWPGRHSRPVKHTVMNATTLAREVVMQRFDLVHSFSRIAYMAPLLPLPLPKLMTFQREISRRSVRLGATLSRGTLTFTGISQWMIQHVRDIGSWRVVPNGVSLKTYDFKPRVSEDAPLVFLGRIEVIKGPHLAVQVARRAGMRLVIAGNIPESEHTWFESQVAPHVDGTSVRYVGPVDDRQKNALLGSARAFLMPIQWDEPFGIVMAEAMACGTPVIGIGRGAVPEVVENGVTGFVADGIDGMVDAVARLSEIDRRACRARVERLYSGGAMAEAYLSLYEERLARSRAKDAA
ncbi:MAG: glycosyltransferase family 4 protein [bacterium]|nr:glycosyltransferase family 4 protein [bacterium]